MTTKEITDEQVNRKIGGFIRSLQSRMGKKFKVRDVWCGKEVLLRWNDRDIYSVRIEVRAETMSQWSSRLTGGLRIRLTASRCVLNNGGFNIRGYNFHTKNDGTMNWDTIVERSKELMSEAGRLAGDEKRHEKAKRESKAKQGRELKAGHLPAGVSAKRDVSSGEYRVRIDKRLDLETTQRVLKAVKKALKGKTSA